MISKTYIFDNLNQLNRLYLATKDSKCALYYSKLAILELCGWIEESMDDIAVTYATKQLKKQENIGRVKDIYVKRVHGFDYRENFRDMLARVIGIINVEKLENKVDSVKLALMNSALTSLKSSRDKEAHTHLRGVTKTLDAPSVTKSNFDKVYDGLKEIERCLRNTM